MADVDADVICLIEVEDRNLLQKFHDGLLYKDFLEPANKAEYKYVYLIDGNDPRGIDVAFLSRLPVTSFCSHIHETTLYDGKTVKTFSRDCLEVELEAPDQKALHLKINHFKSMGYSSPSDPLSNRRRLGQAERVVELLDKHDLTKDYVIVAGDLNSDPSSASMAPLINKNHLYNTLLQLPETQRGTYGTSKKQLDYVFVSEALKHHLQNVRLERRGVYTKTKWIPYPTVTSPRNQTSDHAAVVAEFLLP
ncbi:hypothetical protein BWI97_13950 [Siphonobacter sp. BAB-5405]|nr:hypothetical protein BWI97_13950 [Siphonobacter sp. BAB-5405]